MEKNKVDITIRNQTYSIISTEPPENVIALAGDINSKLSDIMDNSNVSLTQALILAALDFAETAKIQSGEADKLRSEIADYLEDAEKAMTERDKYKRELDKLKAKTK